MTVKEKRDFKRKLNVINYAKKIGAVNKSCRHLVSVAGWIFEFNRFIGLFLYENPKNRVWL
jgi:hypothetical protein